MTETELKNRLTASVDEIEATPDVLDRVRSGGARRLRRRRLTTLAATTLAVVAVGGRRPDRTGAVSVDHRAAGGRRTGS